MAWHEWKSAVIYRLKQAAKTAGERELLVEKFVVAYVGDPLEFGRQVQAEARRRGLGQVARVYVVADGGAWIWNIVADRFAEAIGVLDFYHASQHLWELTHSLHPTNAVAAQAWVEARLHQLRHGAEAEVLRTLAALPSWCAERGLVAPLLVAKTINYFEPHQEHLHYAARAAEGCPVGSGAMESLCAQFQGRRIDSKRMLPKAGWDGLKKPYVDSKGMLPSHGHQNESKNTDGSAGQKAGTICPGRQGTQNQNHQ